MFYKIIERKRDEWLNSPGCVISDLISYIERQHKMRDAQIESIKTYLFLKIECKNLPLWELFASGKFNSTNVDDLEVNRATREILETNPAALALWEYASISDENGYVLSIIDNTNKAQGSDAKYWTDSFLHIKPRRDSYQQTNQVISLCKKFTEQIETMTEVSKLDKINIMSRALEGLSKGCNSINALATRIFNTDTERINFSEYAKSSQGTTDASLESIIPINNDVLKKALKKRESIKLDKSFEIRILDSSNHNIIRGFDAQREMFFYTLFFDEEN